MSLDFSCGTQVVWSKIDHTKNNMNILVISWVAPIGLSLRPCKMSNFLIT